jgi:hypothetical protein
MNEEPEDWAAKAEREYDYFTEALWRELHPEPAQSDQPGCAE